MAIFAGAFANWLLLTCIFFVWFDLTENYGASPFVSATAWALFLMGALALTALTTLGEAFFRFLHGCRRPIRSEEDKLKPLFDSVCKTANINPELYELYISDDKYPNAFALGRKTVCITRSLLNGSTDEEIQGILAHELGHHVYGDAVRGIVFYMITLIGQVIMWGGWLIVKLLSLLTGTNRQNSSDDPAVIFIVFSKILWALMWVFQLFVWIPISIGSCFGSRKQEYRADKYAVKLGYGAGLLSFLTRLIDLDGHPSGFMGMLYRTHPKVGDRIRAIEDYQDLDDGKQSPASVENGFTKILHNPQITTVGLVVICFAVGAGLLAFGPKPKKVTLADLWTAEQIRMATPEGTTRQENIDSSPAADSLSLPIFLQKHADQALISNWTDGKQGGQLAIKIDSINLQTSEIQGSLFDPESANKRERAFKGKIADDRQRLILTMDIRDGYPQGLLKTATEKFWLGETSYKLSLTLHNEMLFGSHQAINLKFAANLANIALSSQEQVYHKVLSNTVYKAYWYRNDYSDDFFGGEVCISFDDMQGKSVNRVTGVMFDPRVPEKTKAFTCLFDPTKNANIKITTDKSTGTTSRSTLTQAFLLQVDQSITLDLSIRGNSLLEPGTKSGDFENFRFYRVDAPHYAMPAETIGEEEANARQVLKNGGLYKIRLRYGKNNTPGDLYLKIDPFTRNTNVFEGAVYDPEYPLQKKTFIGFLYPSPKGLHNIHILLYSNTGIEEKTAKTVVQKYWLLNGTAKFIKLRLLGDSLVGNVKSPGFTLENTPDLEFIKVDPGQMLEKKEAGESDSTQQVRENSQEKADRAQKRKQQSREQRQQRPPREIPNRNRQPRQVPDRPNNHMRPSDYEKPTNRPNNYTQPDNAPKTQNSELKKVRDTKESELKQVR